jgi:7-cyano-7-deazaguanine synthase
MSNPAGAVVLLSGGADSCITLYLLKHSGHTPLITIAFDYGQRHRRELDASREISRMAGAEHFEWKIDHGGSLPSALTTGEDIGTRADGLPTTFVPGRNALFLAAAAGVAKARGILLIGVGFSQVDYSGYPDCREAFIRKQEKALSLAVDDHLMIFSPLLHETKAESVRMARRTPGCWEALARSWTCYDPMSARLTNGRYEAGPFPCQRCPACVLRAKGFEEAGLQDPAAR